MTRLLSILSLGAIAIAIFHPQPLRAQNDVGSYGASEKQNFDQSSTATPTPDANPDQFYVNVSGGTTGSVLTTSSLTPPTGRTGVVAFTQSGNGLYFQQYFTSQSTMDAAFGAGLYHLTIKTSTPNTYNDQFTLPTDDLASIPTPQITNTSTNWTNGALYFDTTKPFLFTWNSTGGGNIGFQIFNSSVSPTLTSSSVNYSLPAGTLSANTAYNAALIFNDPANNGYQKQTNFTIGINDVGYYSIQKEIIYDQSSAAAPTLDPTQPYEFFATINNGSNGTVLASSSVTPPANATSAIAFQTEGTQGLFFQQSFTTQAALDAAFPVGLYNFAIQTATPNSYNSQLNLPSGTYPEIPQITSVTNATWSNGILVVTDYTKAVTLTWNNPASRNAYFQVSNTSINSSQSSSPITTTFTIPAGSLQNNSAFQALVDLSPNLTTNTTIPSANGTSGYQTQVQFVLQTGTPVGSSKSMYTLEKTHVLQQTSNSAPVDGFGDTTFFSPAPYNLSINSPVSGTVTGPSSTSFSLPYNAFDLKYEYQSNALATQASLDAFAPNGTYTFPGNGGTVSLTGNLYPAAAQVTLVNSATPVWNNQGQLVLDPTIANTITWSTVTIPNFATAGFQNVKFQSSGDSTVNIKEQAGATTTTTTPYTTLTIPANTMAASNSMTATHTYTGAIGYGQVTTYNTINSTTFAAALYQTLNNFTAIALKPQAISFAAIPQQVSGGTFVLNATTPSGLPITYTVISGPASLNGSTLTFTGTGTVVIKATQSGNATYASTLSQQTITVANPPATDTPTLPPWALLSLVILLLGAGFTLLPKLHLEI